MTRYSDSVRSQYATQFQILDSGFPDLTWQYHQIAFYGDHPYWSELRSKLEEIRTQTGLSMEIHL